MKGALVDCAIPKITEAASAEPFVLEPEGEAQAERRLAADDPMTTPVILVRGEEMHRAPLAFGAPCGLAEELRHTGFHVHANGQGVSVVAVGGDDVVIVPQKRDRADSDSLLARVKMEKATHFSQVVIFERGLLEPPDPEHLAQETNLVFLRYP